MREALMGVMEQQAKQNQVHELSSYYMREIEKGTLDPMWASEDLGSMVLTGGITEEVAMEVVNNIGLDGVEVIDD